MTRFWAWLRARLWLDRVVTLDDLHPGLQALERGQTQNHLAILDALAAIKAEITRRGDLADEATRRLDLRLGAIERRHQDDAETARNDIRYLTRMTWGTTPPVRHAGPARQPKQFTAAERQ